MEKQNEAHFERLLTSLEERQPTVPDELVQYYCRIHGVELRDERAVRILGLATQKFLQGILQDTLLLSRMRDRLPLSRLKDLGFNPRDKRRVMLIEELLRALKQNGITAFHVPYYSKTSAADSFDNKGFVVYDKKGFCSS